MESPWLNLTKQIVRRLPVARYRAMNWVSSYAPSRVFLAPFPGQRGALLFECDLRNTLAREVYFTGQYEPQETCLVRSILKAGDTFIDVGAHWGYFSILASTLIGRAGRVLAIEADPRIHRTLARNVELNGLSSVKALHAAAGEGPGSITLSGYDERQDNWGISRVRAPGSAAEHGEQFHVPTVAIDTLLEEHGVETVQLLKMDIEGAELFALRGMAEGLRSHRYERILLELHAAELREHGSSTGAIVDQLTGAGYTGWAVDHSPRSTRRAAYARRLRTSDFLRPLDADSGLVDAWPHVLWTAPGIAHPETRR